MLTIAVRLIEPESMAFLRTGATLYVVSRRPHARSQGKETVLWWVGGVDYDGIFCSVVRYEVGIIVTGPRPFEYE